MGMPVGKYRKPNVFSISEGVVTVVCTVGSFICDIDDWHRLKIHRWNMNNFGYATTKINSTMVKGIRTSKTLFFHKLICSAKICDHINRNRGDNRKVNLRPATANQSAQNTGVQSNNSSGFKGVTRYKNTWRAAIKANGKTIRVCSLKTKEEAALAYNMLAKHHFGEFAYLNPVRF